MVSRVVNFYSERPSNETPDVTEFGYHGAFGVQGVHIKTPSFDNVGKTSFDLTDPLGSIGEAAGSIAQFGSGLAGGALGLVGQVGIPGGPTLGDVPKAIGAGLGELGRVELPYAGNGQPSKEAQFASGGAFGSGHPAHLGDVPGAILGVLGAGQRAVERTVAGSRVEEFNRDHSAIDLPPDIAQALEDGTMNVDQAADALVGRNAGFTNNPVLNFAIGTIADPLNLLALGVGRLGDAAKAADIAERAGESLGLGDRFIGAAYRAATRGVPGGATPVVDKLLGPATTGAFRVLGTKPYQALRSGLESIGPDFGSRFEDAMAKGVAQLPRAVAANLLGDEVKAGLRKAADATGPAIERALADFQAMTPERMQRATEELLARVAPRFDGLADPHGWAVDRLSAVVPEASREDIAAILPKQLDRNTLRTIDLATYGASGDELAVAKRAIGQADNIDVQRTTVLGPRTLTVDRSKALLKDIANPGVLDNAIARYDILANRFGGRVVGVDEARKFIEQISDRLPQEVHAAKTGKNALPGPLSAWRKKWNALGYDIGFAPEDLTKTITTPDGEEIFTNPFVHFSSEADPLTMRNPIGRIVDGLFRGVSQARIIQTSRDAFTDAGLKYGLAPNESRALHSAVLHAAKDAKLTPRGLGNYDTVFEKVLGPSRFAELRQKVDPAFLVVDAFRGNLSEVGLTQYITGSVKRGLSERGNVASQIAENIWPTIKFKLSPIFQWSEAIESPLWNAVRGIWPRKSLDEATERVYSALSDLPEFKDLFEGYASTFLAGNGTVAREFGPRTLIGKALSPFPNVQGLKERQRLLQTVSEHGEAFREAVTNSNPKAWRAMEEAFGSSDPSVVAREFMQERLALASGDTAILDKMKPALTGADAETVWVAFRTSLEEVAHNSFTTHYFNPTRGWLERTLNHPYLGLYPLSYYKKVAGEFTRFMIARPFGLKAPLAGYEAVRRARDAMTIETAYNPEFRKFLKDNAGAIYLFQLLIPALPNDLPVNAPAIARHLAEDQLEHKPFDPTKFASRETGDLLGHLGLFRDIGVAGQTIGNVSNDIGGSLEDQLDKAAAMFDGMASAKSGG